MVETCQRDVRSSDHDVLSLGERFGTRRPEHGGKSVTEREFEAALEAGLSLDAFFLGVVSDSRNGIEGDPEVQERLNASWANLNGVNSHGLGRKGPYRQRPVTSGALGLVNRWGLAELHRQLLE